MLGLHRRPRLLLSPSKPSLFELITRKNIEDLADLRQLGHQLGLPDLVEDIDELARYSDSFVFSRPINYLHSTIKTIRMAPSNSSSSGEEKQTGSIFSISGPVIVAENMIGCAMYELVCKPLVSTRSPV
jgi:hypothetical protein